MKRGGWFLALLAGLILVGGAGYAGFRGTTPPTAAPVQTPTTVKVERGDVQQTVTAPGKLIGMREVDLNFGANGVLARLNVRPGDTVTTGQLLAALDTTDLQLQVAQAEQSLLIQQAAYSSTIQADPAAVNSARAALASANTAYQAAQHNLGLKDDQIRLDCAGLEDAENYMLAARDAYNAVANDWKASRYPIKKERELIYKSAINAYELAVARCNLATSKPNEGELRSTAAQVAQAKENLEKLLSPRSETVLRAQAELEQARLTLEQKRAQLAQAAIIAPFDGTVLAVKARTGESVAANASVIVLSDTDAVEAETSVVEEDWPLVQTGQAVELFFDASPAQAVTGRVSRRVPQRIAGDRPLYPIYISLDTVPENIVPGMTVDASIVIDQRSAVLRLPRALVRARSDNTATVKVWTGDRAVERTIKVGLRGDLYVEIIEGLSEGEQVVGE